MITMMRGVFLGSMVAMAAGERTICPTDPSVFGYSSIEDLNHDILLEFEAIQSGAGLPKGVYVYNLCPHTIFQGGDAIKPLLNNSRFTCGNDGDSHNRCTIEGGDTQVRIVDYPDARMKYLSFHGITFSDSEGHGLSAEAHSEVLADFVDCHWVDGHGTSGIHIEYKEYADEMEASEALTSNVPGSLSDEELEGQQDGNVFEHRQLSSHEVAGMSVHLYNSTMSNIHQGGFRAIYNTGSLRMVNVTMMNNQAGVLINIVAGNATIENCHFESMDALSIIRVVNSPMVIILDSNFVENQAVGMVTVISSHVSITGCEFRSNYSPRGGEVLAFSSNVMLQDTCIFDSTAMTSIYRSSSSRMIATNVYGEDLHDDYCAGVLVEDEGSDCFSGSSCEGRCELFTSLECSIQNVDNVKKTSPVSSSAALPLFTAISISAISAMYM